jgi:hypothetical protein
MLHTTKRLVARTGIALVLVAWQAGPAPWGIGIAAVGMLVGVWFGLRVRRPIFTALLVVWAAGMITGVNS